eukprot:TRINITY_DN3777_c0_g2_i1.p1 TRINITY_DN3777_c0_g2~~TRINITY_DN3777_c0_g2_i1.p1  ORF type:complete len:865 (+),score=188.51 TRINITY_DN3777_c0_g2_i1:21-2615(+)
MASLVKHLVGKTSSQSLGPKEQKKFDELMKCLDMKQFNKGLKLTKNILNTHPNHGETLSMRGLFLRSQEPQSKEEVNSLLKTAISKDIKSYLCWHIYALILKADKSYKQALAAYRMALRNLKAYLTNHSEDEEESKSGIISMHKQIADLEIRKRDFANFVETRRALVTTAPGKKENWVGFAIGQFLVANYTETLTVLDAFKGETSASSEQHEKSAFLLFRNLVYETMGDIEKALLHNHKIEKKVVDKIALNSKRAKFLLALNRPAEAIPIFEFLISANPENFEFYNGLRNAVELAHGKDKAQDILLKSCAEVTKAKPRASAPKHFPLQFLTGDLFAKKLDEFVRPRIARGKPSLFKELKPLYSDPAKAATVEKLFHSYEEEMKDSTDILFVHFFLAQHYAKKDGKKALEYVEKAIKHTPTMVNLYTCKGRIHKYAGNLAIASNQFEFARTLDLADRYLNTKSVLYLLRTGNNRHAENVVRLFTREGEIPRDNLNEMQTSWYQNALGDSYAEQQLYKKALRQYKLVENYFRDFKNDQFEFHNYVYRKMNICAYLDMVEFMRTLNNNQFYQHMCRQRVKLYLLMHEDKAAQEKALAKEDKNGEAKKNANGQNSRPKQKKGRGGRRGGRGNQKAPVQAKSTPQEIARQKEEDAIANELKKPLEHAQKYVKKMQEFCGEDKRSHRLAFRVYLHLKKYDLALTALKQLAQLEESTSDTSFSAFFHAVELFKQVDASEGLSTDLKKNLDAERSNLLKGGSGDFEKDTRSFIETHKESLSCRRNGAELLWRLFDCKKDDADILKLFNNVDGASYTQCARALALLSKRADDATVEKFKALAHARFPISALFAPPPEPEKKEEEQKEEDTKKS